jgi:uncharacterized protein YdhG (YjbR/CyaY superfamily)
MSNIDNYLNDLSEDNKKELQRIRELIHGFVPEAEEAFSYDMPAFTYEGKPLIYFAAFKDHLSVFPTAFPIEALKDRLASYTVSKGTIKFTLDNPLSDELIEKLLESRISEIKKGDQA